MAELNKQGRYDRMTDDCSSSQAKPMSVRDSSSCMPPNSRGMEPRLERAIRRGLLLYEAFVSGRDTAANERQQFGKSELGHFWKFGLVTEMSGLPIAKCGHPPLFGAVVRAVRQHYPILTSFCTP